MNLYFRLFLEIIISKFSRKISILDILVTNHIAMPTDIDAFGHINNGRYFTISDYVRVGCLIKSCIWKRLRREKVYPLTAGETAQFRRPILPFQRYKIKTKTLGWDDKFLYVEQTFFTKSGIHALLLVKIIFSKGRGNYLSPSKVFEFEDNVRINSTISNWNLSSVTHWDNISNSTLN